MSCATTSGSKNRSGSLHIIELKERTMKVPATYPVPRRRAPTNLPGHKIPNFLNFKGKQTNRWLQLFLLYRPVRAGPPVYGSPNFKLCLFLFILWVMVYKNESVFSMTSAMSDSSTSKNSLQTSLRAFEVAVAADAKVLSRRSLCAEDRRLTIRGGALIRVGILCKTGEVWGSYDSPLIRA